MRFYTSSIRYKGELPVVDITRQTGDTAFAPSWGIINKFKSGTFTWSTFRLLYRDEMKVSLINNREAWDKLLALDEVVLVCYCSSPDYCHRKLLANYLVNMDAEYLGEV